MAAYPLNNILVLGSSSIADGGTNAVGLALNTQLAALIAAQETSVTLKATSIQSVSTAAGIPAGTVGVCIVQYADPF
jgi:hypothetical protein